LGLHGRAIGVGLAVAASLALAPATASAAGLVAAYDRYVTGKGFEIGLVNALTGATLALPAGVNTNDDELHPTLTPDGRYLVFMRTKLLPKLNGDIVPPAERTLFVADRQAGTVTSLARTGAGPVFSSGSALGWGVRPFERAGLPGRKFTSQSSSFGSGALSGTTDERGSPPSGGLVETVHADHGAILELNPSTLLQQNFPARYLSYAVLDATTGALQSQTVQLTTLRESGGSFVGDNGQSDDFGSATAPAGHPDVRSDDYVAFHMGGDIQSVSWPADDLAVAPEPITTDAPERDPAWSPDGLNLGFIRTSGGQRRLGVFNATPGIQTILNPLASLGPEAPTPQTRAYQEVWGGLSIAEGAPSSAPAIVCDAICRARIQRSGSTTILSPTLSIGSQIGIFVARVVGKRTLLGRTAPRLRVVGRVPLGRAKRGRNRLRWNGRVNGKRLRPGTYLITYRSLKGRRVSNTSDSIRVRVGKGGKIRRAKRERV
jgi:WD40-like Beta Propeller Repeat